MPIDTPDDLRAHLELAIRVELTTIPPYLYAMYSLVDGEGDAAQVIRSVVTEEMLHAALVANVLLAVGGEPRFAATAARVRYPCPLPHHIPPLIVSLERCSEELVTRVFLAIERPELHEAPPEPDRYESLGQFYHALELALEELDAGHDLFADPQLERQLADPTAYQPVALDSETSGGLIPVTDLASARQAIETVIHQGEGVSEERFADPDHRELTHYAKFLELADGTVPLGEVRPVVANPSVERLPPAARPTARLANALYGFTFEVLDGLFGTRPCEVTVGTLYRTMGLVGKLGRRLTTIEAAPGATAGLPFRPHRYAAGDPTAELLSIARSEAGADPALDPIFQAIDAMVRDDPRRSTGDE